MSSLGRMGDAHRGDRTGDKKQRSRGHASVGSPLDASVEPIGDDEQDASGDRNCTEADCNGESEARRDDGLKLVHDDDSIGGIRLIIMNRAGGRSRLAG
jgi:hypothetical protein